MTLAVVVLLFAALLVLGEEREMRGWKWTPRTVIFAVLLTAAALTILYIIFIQEAGRVDPDPDCVRIPIVGCI